MSIDWTEIDATNVLALALFRWDRRANYRVPNGWSGELRRLVYSNGTDQGFAVETAETVMELGPMLARVLHEGVRVLGRDPEFEAYVGALAAGDHDEIVRIERAAEAGDRAGGTG